MRIPVLYIVVPCYNEQEVLPSSHEQLTAYLRGLAAAGKVAASSRVLYVNDGSRDATWQLIEQYSNEPGSVACGVKLAGNAGHQNALVAGLSVAVEHADIMVSIDADLQDDLNAIGEMVDKHNLEGCDIVYGVRRERKTDSWFKRNTALGFYKLMRHLGVKSVFNHADFRLMSRRAVSQLLQYGERNLFLRGIVPLIGYKTASVYYDRSQRMAGESKYPLSKMLNFAVDGITSFSIKPVRLVLSMGITFMLVALVMLAWVLWSYFSGRAVSGWSSMMLSVWFVGGCILIGLGIVGEYIGKIYIEVKQRPRYNIEKTTINPPHTPAS